MELLSPGHFPDYELIDCGNFEKLSLCQGHLQPATGRKSVMHRIDGILNIRSTKDQTFVSVWRLHLLNMLEFSLNRRSTGITFLSR